MLAIAGSAVSSTDDMVLDVGSLDMQAGVSTHDSRTQYKQGDINISQTVWGAAAGGPSVSGSLSLGEQGDHSTTHTNASLTADGHMDMTVHDDATLVGATVHANEGLTASIGGDLALESVQDLVYGSNQGAGISGGMSFGGVYTNEGGADANPEHETRTTAPGQAGDANGANAGVNTSNGRYYNKETVLSSITSGGEVDMTVDGHTDITGAVIASIDENGNDTGDLNLTTGSLDFTDLTDTHYSTDSSVSLNTNVLLGENETPPPEGVTTQPQDSKGDDLPSGTTNLGLHDSSSYGKDKTLATVGEGTITVRDDTEQDTSDLNRDTDLAQEVTKDDSQTTNLYASTTAADSLTNLAENPSEQLNQWKDNVASVGSADAWGKVGENATDALEDTYNAGAAVATDKDLGVGNFWVSLDSTHKMTQLKNDLTSTAEGQALLARLTSDDPDQRLAAEAELGHRAQEKFGIDPSDIHFYAGSETTSESLSDTVLSGVNKGATVTEEGHSEYGNILVNVDNATDGKDMTNTVGHEVYETVTLQTGGENDASQEAIANLVGGQLANRIDQATGGELANVGTGDLAGSNTVRQGTQHANAVGNAQVDYRRFKLSEAQTLDRVRDVIGGDDSLTGEEKQLANLQLNALACAAVECANGVSENDPLYKDLKNLQNAGENLQEQGMGLSQILGEDASESFTHGWRDEFNDALTRNDEALSVVGGTVQAASGAAGVVGGVTIAAGGAIGCGPSAGLTCLAVPVGAGFTALGASEFDAGLDKVFGDYSYTEGQIVTESFSGDTHQGDTSPDVELLKDAGVVGLEVLSAKVGGKYLDKAVDKYKGVEPPINDTPYDARTIRNSLDEKYGAENVISTTIPPTNKPNVKLAGQAHPETGVVFDHRGFPIFDDFTAFDTKVDKNLGYKQQMQAASKGLAEAIDKGDIPQSGFTPKQLEQIRSGSAQIDNLTWHHHQDSGRMQLIPRDLHDSTRHIGGNAMKGGK